MTPHDATDVADGSLERDEDGAIEQYVCGNCGTPLDPQEKLPVVAKSDGVPNVLLFCGSTCRSTWLATEADDE